MRKLLLVGALVAGLLGCAGCENAKSPVVKENNKVGRSEPQKEAKQSQFKVRGVQ